MQATSVVRLWSMTFTTFTMIVVFGGCSPQQQRSPSGPVTLVDFLQTYNAYATGQLYLKRGQHKEALVEYKQSFQQFTRLDEAARRLLREQYGLTQEQVERELAITQMLAQHTTTAPGDNTERERFRELVLTEFYPYGHGTPVQGEVGPGTQITPGNWPAAQNLLPQEILQRINDGHFVIQVQETTDLPPGDEYVVATMGSGESVRLRADEELEGYIAGRPFPALDSGDAQAGVKAAWNLFYRDAGDRLEQWSDTVVLDQNSSKTYSFSSYDARACGMYRAKQQYNLPEWEQNDIVCKEFSQTFALPVSGYPVAGGHTDSNNQVGQSLLLLRHHYASDHRPIGQWFITPMSGRMKSLAYDPEKSALGSTAIDEDVVNGQIVTHDWRLIAATVALVPGFVQHSQALFGGIGGGYPLDPWELRYVYVLEKIPRSPHHPYSRQRLYVDQQTFVPFYVITFDEKGRHWRTAFFSYGNPEFHPENREAGVPILLGQSWIDHHTHYATVTLVNKALYNQSLSLDLFTLSSLMQRGK